jgi:HK97 family phage major capsid protein
MTAQELVSKSLEAYRRGQAIVEDCDRAGVAPATDRIAEANRWFDEADSWKLRADAAKRQADLKQWHELPDRRFPMGGDDDDVPVQDDARSSARLAGASRTALALADPRFKSLDPRAGFHRAPEFKRAFEAYVRFGERSLTPEEHKALSSLTDTEGGFLVTEEFRAEVIRKLRNLVYIRRYATVIQTSAAAVAFPAFDPIDTQTAPPVVTQNAAIPQLQLTNLFGKVQFAPHKRAVIIPIPLELVEDAVVDVGSLLTDFFALRFAEIEENDFINGTGVNQPLGLVTAPNLPNIAIAGSTTNMVPEDLVKTAYAMRAVYRRDAAWLMHRLVVQAVRLFRTNIGGAGTGSFMFQPSLQAGEPATLLGFPLLESEFMPNPYTGSAGTPMALFSNLKFYWIVDRIDLMVQRLNELYAGNDQVGFRMRKRYDGAPVLADPFMFLTRN